MKKRIAFLWLTGILLTACSAQIPTPSQAQILFMAAQTVASNQDVTYYQYSESIVSSSTQSPTRTLIPPSQTQVPANLNSVNIATQIAQPRQIDKAARIYGVSVLDNGSVMVIVEFSPIVESNYAAEVGQDSLTCNTLPENPNRLFCNGSASLFGLMQPFRLYQEGRTDPVYTSELWIPAVPFSPGISSIDSQTSTPSPAH